MKQRRLTPAIRRSAPAHHPWRPFTPKSERDRRKRLAAIDVDRLLRNIEYRHRRIDGEGPSAVEPIFDEGAVQEYVEGTRNKIERDNRFE